MSNRQLGWDDQRIRDRVSPRENAEAAKNEAAQAEENEEMVGGDEDWVPPGNKDQGSRKK